MTRRIAEALALIWLGGCASYGSWEPTIDPRVGSNQETQTRDLAECKELASKASGGTGTEAAKGTGAGAVVGAATGAVIGAVSGSPGRGAALGGAVGGTGGGVHQGLSAEKQYKRAYSKCLEGRGHRVIN